MITIFITMIIATIEMIIITENKISHGHHDHHGHQDHHHHPKDHHYHPDHNPNDDNHQEQTPIFLPTAFRSSQQWQEPHPLDPAQTSVCGNISVNDDDDDDDNDEEGPTQTICSGSISDDPNCNHDCDYLNHDEDDNSEYDNYFPTMASSSPFDASTLGQST